MNSDLELMIMIHVSRNEDIYRHQAPVPAVTEERDVDVSVWLTQPLVTIFQDALPRLQQRPLCQPDVGHNSVSGGRRRQHKRDHGGFSKIVSAIYIKLFKSMVLFSSDKELKKPLCLCVCLCVCLSVILLNS